MTEHVIFENFTGKTVKIQNNEDSDVRTLKPSKEIAEAIQVSKPLKSVSFAGIKVDVFAVSYSKVVRNLPEPKAGVFYIVDESVVQAATDREDLLVPLQIVEETADVIVCKGLGFI